MIGHFWCLHLKTNYCILVTGNKPITSRSRVFFFGGRFIYFNALMKHSVSVILPFSSLSSLQLCFAPCFLAAFFWVSGVINGLTVGENVSKLKRVSITFHVKHVSADSRVESSSLERQFETAE